MHLLAPWLIAIVVTMLLMRRANRTARPTRPGPFLARPSASPQDSARPSRPGDRPNPIASAPRLRPPVAPAMPVSLPERTPPATDASAAMMAAMTGPGLCTPTARTPLSQPQE